MDFLTFHYLIYFLGGFVGLWLSAWVYFAGRKKRINQLFASMVLLWIVGEMTPYFLFRSISLPQRIIFFLPKLEVFSVFVFFILFYFFSMRFLHENRKFPLLNKIIVVSASIGALVAAFTNLFQKSVLLSNEMKGLDLKLTLGGKIFWLGFVIIVTLFILYRFVVNYFKSKPKDRLRIQYFLFGILSWVAINLVFNVFFPLIEDTFRYAMWGNYSILVLFGFTAYAIVKRHLFGIKVVLTQLLVGLIAVLLLVNVVGSDTPFEYTWKGSLLVVFLLFGYLLIKSILREIKQKEEFKKMATNLQKANVKLKQLDATKTEFIAVASHQLRTPLTAIRGYISLVRHDHYGHIPKKAQDALRLVYQASLRLLNLSNRLLDVSRIQLGKISFNPQPVSLVDIISSVVQELQIQAKEKKLKLVFEKPDQKMPLLSLDVGKIRQVLLNILDNDLKYTQKGGITIYLRSLDGRVRIKIQDTGMGMTPEELGKIFKSFSRGDAGMAFHSAGAGLGLYVAKKFVDLHHGRIWATSPGKGRGSVFWIELPLRLDQAKLKKDLKSFPEGGGEKIP